MRNLLRISLTMLLIILSTSGCAYNQNVSNHNENYNNLVEKNEKLEGLLLQKDKDIMELNSTNIKLKKDIDNLSTKIETLINEKERIGGKIEDLKLEVKNLWILNESYRAQLLFSPPMNLPSIFKLDPEPKVENGWFIINDNQSIEINGYKDAKSFKFYLVYLGTDAPPIELGTDIKSEDGWKLVKGLHNGFVSGVLYGEYVKQNGQIGRTPLLPVKFE